ncbi:DUF2294 domain-containing protein [Paenibacillus abyssi]|uniref:Na+-translocating membrane potential-generating system MpsC domain-containing protein n=1 Tax=Paenibacillus abyssi TaxID=1340531 RepID=A0A917D4D8_9BACL|nr:DUF2294 domain-containing protein [Paenibacillus abyssi]GGG08438.1 hypothetical protein GCM10010916_26670 [Paenibacillus abyssi]
MQKKEHFFNQMVRKVRKELFGKGPEDVHTIFVENKVITTMRGNLTPVEKLLAQTEQGMLMVHQARTKLIQEYYGRQVPEGMEELIGSKLVRLFSDIHVKDDEAVSVFVFEKPVRN